MAEPKTPTQGPEIGGLLDWLDWILRPRVKPSFPNPFRIADATSAPGDNDMFRPEVRLNPSRIRDSRPPGSPIPYDTPRAGTPGGRTVSPPMKITRRRPTSGARMG